MATNFVSYQTCLLGAKVSQDPLLVIRFVLLVFARGRHDDAERAIR